VRARSFAHARLGRRLCGRRQSGVRIRALCPGCCAWRRRS